MVDAFPAEARRLVLLIVSEFNGLAPELEGWFKTSLRDLPETLRLRVETEFVPLDWETLSADQRRSVALQLDYQHDPANAQDRQFWMDFFERLEALKAQLIQWEAVAAPTAADLAQKEARLAELHKKIALMDLKMQTARGDNLPVGVHKIDGVGSQSAVKPVSATRYIAYPKAMRQLAERLGATPEELAAWIWSGPKDGGIAAYTNANELDPPPPFVFMPGSGVKDYVAPLMACWFKEEDIRLFKPADRYITGAALIDRWSRHLGLHAVAFIQAKIAESRLMDMHPVYGGTQGTYPEYADWPSLESGFFHLSDVVQIEAEDFDAASQPGEKSPPALGTAEWRKQKAKAAADAKHDKPGGSRDKQQRIRDIWASGKYTTRDLCAEQECAALDMSISTARRALTNTPDPSRC
ncbi:hypothetical protein [Hydrogenophaga atypica]|uniref:Uncharacterized protein n=1 Tax=Hydrogenophaga atypica TaxID=249409 RepID=A0ABW2QLG6_9BURK